MHNFERNLAKKKTILNYQHSLKGLRPEKLNKGS